MITNSKKKLYIIAGPTAVGKSALGVEFAAAVNGEIVSADSMQVYKYMDIGTAKITEAEMKGIRHHLIDVLDPREPFHVVEFKAMAEAAIEDIYSRGKVPVIVGGTGFYIQSLLYDIDFAPEGENPQMREELTELVSLHGPEYIHNILYELDPDTAKTLHPNNVKRVIRAIEFARLNGSSLSEHNKEQRVRESAFDYRYFVLNDERALIYERIDRRVEKMLAQGLVEEVKQLLDMGCLPEMTSMQGIGYKQLIPYIYGERTIEEAEYLIKRDSRHYAKRQLTWFNREKDLYWIDRRQLPKTDKQLEFMKGVIKEEL